MIRGLSNWSEFPGISGSLKRSFGLLQNLPFQWANQLQMGSNLGLSLVWLVLIMGHWILYEKQKFEHVWAMFFQFIFVVWNGLQHGRYTKPWFFKQNTPSKSSLLDALDFAVLDGKNTYTMPQECHRRYNDDLEVHVPAPNNQCGPCVVPIFHFRCVISPYLSLSLSLTATFLVRIPIQNPNPNSFEHLVNPKALIPKPFQSSWTQTLTQNLPLLPGCLSSMS